MTENKISFTKAQTAAIETKGKNLLVSAAAGSGKTATLTERIIRSLTDTENPSDISKMLVVTFTRAAAQDLRQKIFKALSLAIADDPKNKHLSSQLVKLENAKICTIDSFYYDLLRENSSSLGLPSNLRIADTAEAALLAKEIMDATISDFYNRDLEAFSRFAESFVSIRGMSRLGVVLLDLYSHISSYPEGIEFLRLSAEDCFAGADGDFFDTRFGSVLRENTADELRCFIAQLSDCVDFMSSDEELSQKYLPSFSYDLTFCKDLLCALEGENGYACARDILAGYSPIKLKSLTKATEDSVVAKEMRAGISKSISDLSKKSFALSPEAISTAMKDTAKMTLILHGLLCEFEAKLTEEKLSRGFLDFDDIRRYVLKLLVRDDGTPTETAKNISERYTDIYIDEYQDVDRVQDMIFFAISNGKNRFMVGDIKQSIYSFRGAEPSVFSGYRKAYPLHDSDDAKSSPSESIFMSENFRCDRTVIDFTNRVCSYLFGLFSESIGYTAEDDLVFAKSTPSDYQAPKVEITVAVPPSDEESEYVSNADNNRYAEAKYIAATISELLRTGRKANGERILPSDIAIMFRSGKMKEHLTRALDEFKIEWCGAENGKYFEDPNVLLVLSLMNVIDNPHRDIHLAATLRSPLFDVSLESLVVLRKYCDSSYSLYDCVEEYAKNENNKLSQKCREFISEIDLLRDMTLSLPVDRLLKNIYSSKRFCAAGLCGSENLTLLYEYARKFESGSFKGLYNFIEYINKLIADKTTFDIGTNTSSATKVSLMTIHHSKGLEFPVCFLAGTSGEFNRNEFKESMLFEASVGVAMKLPDDSGFARMNTPLREAIASRILASNAEEEIRVLYVALTRARERLYITGSSKKSADELLAIASQRKRYSMRHTLMKCKSYLDWILLALADTTLDGVCDLNFVEADKIEAAVVRAEDAEKTEDSASDPTLVESLKEKFAFKYPYASLSRLPAKISVSRLSPDVLDENDDSLDLSTSRSKTAVPPIFTDGVRKASAAERGTATHLFLQFCDFARTKRTGVREELSRLIEERYIPKNSEELVFIDELERFFDSELFEKIKTAKEVIREQRFNILLPPSMFSKDEQFIGELGDEMLAVQGVIDLVIIDSEDRLCLYDYKTDRLSRQELTDTEKLTEKMQKLHSQQISYYKLAVAKLFDRPCDIAQIYSTHAAKTVDIH